MSLSINEKRLLKDVININKHPLTEHGIFYIHDSDNIKKGAALNAVQIFEKYIENYL